MSYRIDVDQLPIEELIALRKMIREEAARRMKGAMRDVEILKAMMAERSEGGRKKNRYPKRYDKETYLCLRTEAVRLYTAGVSSRDVCSQLGVAQSTLFRWLKQTKALTHGI